MPVYWLLDIFAVEMKAMMRKSIIVLPLFSFLFHFFIVFLWFFFVLINSQCGNDISSHLSMTAIFSTGNCFHLFSLLQTMRSIQTMRRMCTRPPITFREGNQHSHTPNQATYTPHLLYMTLSDCCRFASDFHFMRIIRFSSFTPLSLSFCLCLHWTTFGLLVKRFNFEQNIQQQHSYPCNKDTWSCATFPPEFNVIITWIHVFLRGVTGDISTKDDKNENHRSSPPLSPPPTNIINLFCKSNKRNRRDFSQKNQLVFIIVSEILYNPQFEFSSSVNF